MSEASYTEEQLFELFGTTPTSMRWHRIETAPKDGRDCLIFCEDSGEQFVAYWNTKAELWSYAMTFNGPICLEEPTHWMPLPPPPAENQQ